MLLTDQNGWETTGETVEVASGSRRAPRSAIVIGAGVVGLATAYALARRGVAVTVIESRDAPGCEASFANGAQLSYAYTDALASPALLRHMPGIVLGMDPATQLRPSLDPNYLVWLLRFLRNSTRGRFMHNTLAGLKLGLESRLAMQSLQQRHHLDFGHQVTGKLHIHASAESLASARTIVAAKRVHGAEQHVLDRAEAVRLEPALADHGPFAGAIHTPGDEAGDPHRFCIAMAALLQARYGVVIRLGTTVQDIAEDDAEARATTTTGEQLVAGEVIICAGIGSGKLARRLGLRSLLMPMKGYSFTAMPGTANLRVSVTDVARKIVLCPLDGMVRVAGLAEIGERSTATDPKALERLRIAARASLPSAANYDQIAPGWAGIRPMTASSLPRIGPVSPRIAVNIGHGMLGWTYAMGSGERLAQSVLERVA
ncbi:FAD-dependent oxidoreductase [Novosphingobium aquae]|uniref:FAD-dependent oxidoreductase n=1 Tax=Novosphingobium aquae TaxID=3133435 RepID=A0ABU8SBZ8_9SPHN